MRLRHLTVAATLLGVMCLPAQAEARDISRDTLAPDDGWAAYGTGTTGGAAADDAHVFTVTTRAELVRALDGGSDTPKIIRIAGTIDANTDEDGHRLDCADYATDGYSVSEWLRSPVLLRDVSQSPSCPGAEWREPSALVARPSGRWSVRSCGLTEEGARRRLGAGRAGDSLPQDHYGSLIRLVSLRKYLAAYDPRTWGAAKPSGPQEDARQASAARQAERVQLTVGSNTTIVGLGHAVLKGASLQIRNADNVIVRNLELRDAYDCFPVWQPNTGGLGDWKTAYDNIWLTGATHVWIDHITASDKGHPDAEEPTWFARNYLRHDGLLDITNGSDLVTVSWSRFADHDKAMLIGNSDSVTGDRGKLRVTLHHNEFESVVQRAPRVRFGQVHVYDNRYVVTDDYRYSLGVSTESGIHAENNAFHTPSHIEVADLVKSWNGSALHQTGTLFNGYPVDLLAIHNAYNSGSERDLTADVGWTPTLHGKIDSAEAADREVARGAGAGRIP